MPTYVHIYTHLYLHVYPLDTSIATYYTLHMHMSGCVGLELSGWWEQK